MATDRELNSLTALEYVANSAIEKKLAGMTSEDLLYASRHLKHMTGGRAWQIILAFSLEIRKRYAERVGWVDSPE